jgi:copper chaperone
MIQFTLPDMTCGHCVKVVTETVRRVDAQAQLRVDLPTHAIDSPKPAADFAAALAEEGYAPA